MTIISIGLGLLLVVVNAVVTTAVLRSTSYEPLQKRLQFLFIWLAPIIGAGFSWYVLREEMRQGARAGDGGIEDFRYYSGDAIEGSCSHDGGSDNG